MSSITLYTHVHMHLSVCANHLFNANVSALKRGDFLPLHNANLSERVCVCACVCVCVLLTRWARASGSGSG